MAVFKGNTHAVFLDRKEAKGPIDQQIEDAMVFVKKHINLGSRIADVYREDIYELPMDSVRELISNAVCHRSYLSPGSIQVAIYDDRLDVTSPGRLSPDLIIDHLIEGNSRVCNIAIGAAFQYMHIIERWGSGIPRVFEDARMYGLGDPEIKDFGTSFRVSLHRKPFETDPFGVVNPSTRTIESQNSVSKRNESQSETQNDTQNDTQKRDPLAEKIIAAMKANPQATRADIAKQAGVSLATIARKLKEMNCIRYVGSSKKGHWEVDDYIHAL